MKLSACNRRRKNSHVQQARDAFAGWCCHLEWREKTTGCFWWCTRALPPPLSSSSCLSLFFFFSFPCTRWQAGEQVFFSLSILFSYFLFFQHRFLLSSSIYELTDWLLPWTGLCRFLRSEWEYGVQLKARVVRLSTCELLPDRSFPLLCSLKFRRSAFLYFIICLDDLKLRNVQSGS